MLGDYRKCSISVLACMQAVSVPKRPFQGLPWYVTRGTDCMWLPILIVDQCEDRKVMLFNQLNVEKGG